MPTGARTITRVRRPKVDKLSTTPPGDVSNLEIRRVIILPRQTYEEGRGWVTVEGWDIYILPTSQVVDPAPDGRRRYADGDIVASDLIEIDGGKWQVDGPPAPYDKGAVRKATMVKVKRVGS